MDKTLLKAILSMDAYNRGYDQGIFLGELDGQGQSIENSDIENVSIGLANIISDSSVLLDSNLVRTDQPESFYALAYQMPNDAEWGGEIIISYRGTDYPDHEIRRVA